MLKEKKTGIIHLGPTDVFEPPGKTGEEGFGLTPLGSCLEGIISVENFLANGSGDVTSKKRSEWNKHIASKWAEVGIILNTEMTQATREHLLSQQVEIVQDRTRKGLEYVVYQNEHEK